MDQTINHVEQRTKDCLHSHLIFIFGVYIVDFSTDGENNQVWLYDYCESITNIVQDMVCVSNHDIYFHLEF